MLARECAPENAGVAGYAEAFRCVLSGKQASIQSRYLRTAILVSSDSVRFLFFLVKENGKRKDRYQGIIQKY